MPRASKQQSLSHKEAITEISARLMRERGIAGVSVADLMGAAGLTHGGFYGHFDSKESLAGAACAHAFAQSLQRWKGKVAVQPDHAAALRALTEGYLSTSSRDTPGTSCPTTALACEVAREARGTPLCAAFLAGTEQLIEVLASLQEGDRRAAMAQFATMVGAMVLARATAGSGLSDELLSAASEHLLARISQRASGEAT